MSLQRRVRQTAEAEDHCGYCLSCGKVSYALRSRARKKIRLMGRRGMREYRCPLVPSYWHIGHLPKQVRRGDAGAAEIYGRQEEERQAREAAEAARRDQQR